MEAECKKCNRGIRGDVGFRCGGLCGKNFHIKCTGLVDYDRELVRTNNNILFFCDDCVDSSKVIFKNLGEILNLVKDNNKNILEHEKKISAKLENMSVNNGLMTVTHKETYASQLLKEPPVVVKPKVKQTGSKTKEDLRKNVDPSNLKINSVTTKHNGVIEILCDDEGERNKVKNAVEAKMGNEYDVRVPQLRKPKIFVTGISEEINAEQLEYRLKQQNDILKESEIKCLRIRKIVSQQVDKKFEYFNAIVEVDVDSFYKVLNTGKINIGWDKCKVFEASNVKRCFKCLGFNHESKNCVNTPNCRKCGGEHDSKTCHKPVVKKCVNCTKANQKLGLELDIHHETMDRACPVYLRKVEADKKRRIY